MATGEHLVSLPTSRLLGQATVRYGLSDAPLLQRDLFAQWVWQPPRGGTGPSDMSPGLRIQVR